jgi:hypothetical protein
VGGVAVTAATTGGVTTTVTTTTTTTAAAEQLPTHTPRPDHPGGACDRLTVFNRY